MSEFDELYVLKVVKLLREQLDWEIKTGSGVYNHITKAIRDNASVIHQYSPEEFVELYRLKFKPGFPDHPTGGIETDFVLIAFDQALKPAESGEK